MILSSLSLLGFKNYPEAQLTFHPKLNAFTGPNGSGKTTVLDAIYYLAFCKSFFSYSDTQHVRKGDRFFMIHGQFSAGDQEFEVACSFTPGEGKVFKKDKKEYPRLSDHIGLIPLVMIAPDDSSLLHEGSDERRKFMDSAISQYDKIYLQQLIRYNKSLLQRNALLKSFAEKNYFDVTMLQVFDDRLVESGNYLFEARLQFFHEFAPRFQSIYQYISGSDEQAAIHYQSQLQQKNWNELISESLDTDRKAQFTTRGLHKDDITFEINGLIVKKYASQGQQKSCLLALKLAQYMMLRQHTEQLPLLLLDDIFDKLDSERLGKLMQLASGTDFGQIFLTDTDTNRVKQMLETTGLPYKLFLTGKTGVNPV